MKKIILSVVVAAFSFSAMANVIGVSTHPFQAQKQVVNTEFTSNLSSGSGFGVQARYYNRINRDWNIDAGAGFSGGERDSRFFLGADYMLIPDYDNQPRISFKSFFERTNDFNNTFNNIGVAPTLSKGFSFWGHEAFPFVALPVKLGLNSDSKRYDMISSLALGITGRLPIEGTNNLIGNIEANLDIDNSYTALLMGVSYPL
jgi:hypothetical protein